MGWRNSDLLKLLTRGKVLERVSAAEGLGRYSSEESTRALIKALEDKSYRVRETAASSLGAIGSPEAVSALIRALKDRDALVQMEAAEQLGLLRAGEAVDGLAELLQTSPDSLVRTFAADSLGEIGDERAIPALLIGLKDRELLVRGYSAEGLGLIGVRENIPAIEMALSGERRHWAKVCMYEALYDLGQKEMLPQITRMLKSRNYRVRCVTANILGGIADESNSQLIAKALEVALEREQTVAAKEAIKNSLSIISGSEP